MSLHATHRLQRAMLAACLLGATLVACGEGGHESAADVDGAVVRPGDSVLDHLADARVVGPADSNLPAELEALAGGAIRVRAPVSPLAWERVWVQPPSWAPALAAAGNPEIYWAWPPLPLIEGENVEPPVPLIGGERVESWNIDAGAPMPERLAVWREGEGILLATGVPGKPGGLLRDLGLEGSVPALTEFAVVDRGASVTGRPPLPADLRTQQELDSIVRRGLLLAAPAQLQLDVGRLGAERLEFSVGVVDNGWTLVDGIVQRVHGRSDGMGFAIDVLGMGEAAPVRVWETQLSKDDVGARWVDAQVDLSAWTGQAITLSLVTDAGPSGDRTFDYGVWGGLRFRGGETRAPLRPHVVLIDIDTLRADRLGSHGGTRGLTPQLDAWAARNATVYVDTVATAPWTLPSTVSMFTGLAVHQHGIDKASDALSKNADTLVTYLADAGYETYGIATGGYLRPAYGFDLGFDSYETREPKDIDWTSALDLVRTRDSERPVFLFLHTYFVHAPYEYEPDDVDPDYDGPLRGIEVDRDTVFDPWHDGELQLTTADRQYVEDLYDGLVRSMDRTVSDFLDQLEAAFGDEPVMVVLTSDHGEAFLEHDLYGHGLALWGEVLRVPLLVRYPQPDPGVSDVPASGVDLLPTVLQAVGLPVPEGLPGRPLQSADERSVRVAQYEASLRSTMSEGFKLIEPYSGTGGPVLLFDLADDLAERRNLSEEDQARVQQLRQRLQWFLATYPERESSAGSSTADSAALEELMALGYLGK